MWCAKLMTVDTVWFTQWGRVIPYRPTPSDPGATGRDRDHETLRVTWAGVVALGKSLALRGQGSECYSKAATALVVCNI